MWYKFTLEICQASAEIPRISGANGCEWCLPHLKEFLSIIIYHCEGCRDGVHSSEQHLNGKQALLGHTKGCPNT